MEQLTFTEFLNHLFGPPVTALLQALHIHPKHPATPITNRVAMEILVVLLLTIFFIAVRMRLSVERPGGLQHTMEGIYGFIENLAGEIIGHHPARFVPYLTALGLFILSCNLLGIVPGLESPTAVPVRAAGLRAADVVLLPLCRRARERRHWIHKHFIGPQEGMPLVVRIFLPILIFPIEVFSHTGARPVAHRSSLRQHVRGRDGDAGIFLAGAAGHSDCVRGSAHRRVVYSDVHFRAARLPCIWARRRRTSTKSRSQVSGVSEKPIQKRFS